MSPIYLFINAFSCLFLTFKDVTQPHFCSLGAGGGIHNNLDLQRFHTGPSILSLVFEGKSILEKKNTFNFFGSKCS